MKNRFNFTGRKRIGRADVRIAIERNEGLPAVRFQRLVLDDLVLSPDAKVLFEIETGRIGLSRHQLGTVSALDISDTYEVSESDLINIRFRIKVVGVSGRERGRLLAQADHIYPDDDGRIASLLEVKPSEDLGQRIWSLNISELGPELLINTGVGDWKDVGRSSLFQSLVFPAAVVEIYRWLGHFEEPEDDSIQGRWRDLFRNAGFDPNDLETLREFESIEEFENYLSREAHRVADAFARTHKTLDAFRRAMEAH